MRRLRAPRPAAAAFRRLREEAVPATLLGDVQALWATAVGATTAAEAEPVAEREGTITVACRSAVWAQELDLMGPELRARLNGALGAERVAALRFTADADRHRRPAD